MVEKNQHNDLNEKKLTNINSKTVKTNPKSDNGLGNKKHVDESLSGIDFLRINQSKDNYLNVFLCNDVYNISKYDKIQITDTTNN